MHVLSQLNIKLSKLLLLLCFVSACQKKKAPVENTISGLPEDFTAFYEQFHKDSLFQMQHIDFPLKGLPDGADPEEKNFDDFYYTSDNWVMHKTFNPQLFNSEFLILADILIEERITEKKYQLMIIRRFAKGSQGWRLIYYAGLNKWTDN
ncbi:MAG: DUF4348 domain-containing protein [Saprospiraceae bacterium]|nr:DUF4348 domain-containing protein [Saprospiraceae bacterium]